MCQSLYYSYLRLNHIKISFKADEILKEYTVELTENNVISTLMSHRSFRKYTNQKVTDEDLDIIIRSAQSAPSWVNGQHVSIITISDSDRRKKIAEFSGNQKHIIDAPVFLVFCADFHRVKVACELEGKEFAASQNIDLLIVGASDVGISLANAITAAESLGMGTVPIGGIRRKPLEIIEMLGLPEYVIPISGLCIGYPGEHPDLKPRFPKATIVHDEQYNADVLDAVKEYNQIYSDNIHERTNGLSNSNWSYRIADFYSEPFYKNNSYQDVRKMLQQQGIAIEG